jgi:hypothetical protein
VSRDPRKQAVEVVRSARPRSSGHKVVSQDEFLDGFISKVTYRDDGTDAFLWVVATSKCQNHAEKESQLVQQMNVAVERRASKWSWARYLFNITGWLAVILIGVSSYLLISEKEIPEFLKAAFLTVIGFYFGGLVSNRSGRAENDEG